MSKKAKKSTPSAFVLDGSVAVAWCFPDEKAPYPRAVLDSLVSSQVFVPALWYLEIGNALLVGEWRKRSTEADTVHWLSFLGSLPMTVDTETTTRAWSDVLSAARAHHLSIYDATYLELALRRGLPLATLDDKLKTAAAAAGVVAYEP